MTARNPPSPPLPDTAATSFSPIPSPAPNAATPPASVSLSAFGIDADEIRQRKAFLDFADEDADRLRVIHPSLQAHSNEFAEAFYAHLYQFPELRGFLSDAATLARLKASQSRYFDELTRGDYGPGYVENRLRVGIVHQRIGLAPKWHIGAYAKYLVELIPLLWRLFDGDAHRFLPTCKALLKIVCFDMGLALDTYHQADLQTIVQHKNYAAHLVNRLTSGLVVLDAEGRIRSCNPAMAAMLGLPDTALPPGAALSALLPGAELAAAVARVRDGSAQRQQLVIGVPTASNGMRHLDIDIGVTELAGETLLLLHVEDVTERLQAQRRLRASEERFRMTFNQVAVGLAHIHISGRITRANDKLCAILGYSRQALHELDIRTLTHPDELRNLLHYARRLRDAEIDHYARECRCLHQAGHYVWVNVTASALREDPDGFHFILVVEDISLRKQAAEKLRHLASHDALTNLPNRMLVEDRLSHALIYAQRARRHVAVMFIDLDRFKNINDSLGHGAGDDVLVAVAQRLSACVRTGDTVSRISGDEFVVVLADIAREEDVQPIAEAMLHALTHPLQAQGQEIFVSGSIGVSLFPKDAQDSAALLKYADIAMYRAKDSGRNNVQFYTSAMSARMLDRLRIEADLRHALEREQFVLHYQPQVNLANCCVVGVEALVRWQPPGKPMVWPADFIPIAEDSGFIVAIGEWVLRAACRQHAAWRDAGTPHVSVSVNLSAHQFRQPDLVDKIAAILAENACGPGCITLEITESVVMDDPAAAAETLRKLSDMGVRLAIDDFGTGYSSLSYLKRFPIDTLKIDRSFVRDVTQDADDAAIVSSIIALARKMNISVIAEGVETDEQCAFLREQGCEQMQGYLFSKPISARELEALFAQPGTVCDSVVSCDMPRANGTEAGHTSIDNNKGRGHA